MDFTLVLQRMGELLLLMAAGWLAGRLRIIDKDGRAQLSQLLLYFFMPMMTLDSFSDKAGDPDAVALRALLPRAFLVTILFILFLSGTGYLLALLLRAERAERPLYAYMAGFGNFGFIGFPVVTAVFTALWGESSVSAGLLFAAVAAGCYQILVNSYGVLLLTGGAGAMRWKTLLLSPSVLSCVAGVLLLTFQTPLPPLLAGVADSLGGITGPVSLLLVGASLADISLRELADDRRALLFCLLRQLVVPFLTAPIIRLCVPFSSFPEQLLQAELLVQSAVPIGSLALPFALRYGADDRLASRAILLSTLLSAAGIPLFVLLCLT